MTVKISKQKGCQKYLLSILILLCLPYKLAAQEAIRITNGEWEPYMSEYTLHYGVNSHIVAEAFKLEGIKVEWGFFPWKRAYQLAKKGVEWDASATWWPAKETKEAFLIGDAVSQTSFVFFHLKDKKLDWNRFDDLKNLRIGGTLEYDYGEAFTGFLRKYNKELDWAASDEQGYKKLLLDRIDVLPNDRIVGLQQIRNTFSIEDAERFTFHPKEFEHSTLHLIISKNSPHAEFFLERFNAGFKKLRENGKLREILDDFKQGKYVKKVEKVDVQ